MIHFVDQFHVPGQQLLNKAHRPFLEGLRQHCVVSVRESVVHNVPCVTIGKLFFVNEDSKQFDRRDSRVGVVELDLILLCEL